jgi:hypothetical protein
MGKKIYNHVKLGMFNKSEADDVAELRISNKGLFVDYNSI